MEETMKSNGIAICSIIYTSLALAVFALLVFTVVKSCGTDVHQEEQVMTEGVPQRIQHPPVDERRKKILALKSMIEVTDRQMMQFAEWVRDKKALGSERENANFLINLEEMKEVAEEELRRLTQEE